MPAPSVLCCSVCDVAELGDGGHQGVLERVDRFEPGLELFELLGHGADGRLERRLAHAGPPPSPPAAADGAAAGTGVGQLVDLAVEGVELLFEPPHRRTLFEPFGQGVDLAGQGLGDIVAGGLRLAVQEIRSDLFLGLVQQLAEGLQPLGQRGQGVGLAPAAAAGCLAGGDRNGFSPLAAGTSGDIGLEGRGKFGLGARFANFFFSGQGKAIVLTPFHALMR